MVYRVTVCCMRISTVSESCLKKVSVATSFTVFPGAECVSTSRGKYESLFCKARAQDVSTFLHQNNNKLQIFLFFMSRLAVARFD